VYFAPPPTEGVPLGIGYQRSGQKTRITGLPGRERKSDNIFNHLDTIHQRDGQTDGQTDWRTPGDSKDSAYAQHRAVKTKMKNTENKNETKTR